MKEDWKQELRKRMAAYQKPAPELSWTDIELAVKKAKSRKVSPLWPRYAAAAAVLALVCGLGVWYLVQRPLRLPQVAVATHPRLEKAPDGPTTIPTDTLSPAVGQPLPVTPAVEQPLPQPTRPTDVVEPVAAPTTESLLLSARAAQTPAEAVSAEPVTRDGQTAAIASEQAPVDRPVEQAKTSSSRPEKKQTLPPASGSKSVERPSYATPVKGLAGGSRSHALTAKAYFTNVMGSNSFGGGALFDAGPAMADAEPYGYYDPRFQDTGGLSMLNNMRPVLTEDVQHHQPIHVGLSVRYELTDRWSLESGLSYSYLTSDITTLTGNYASYIEQKLTYIGIPLHVNYTLWQNRYLAVYASAGGEASKMVDGKRSTEREAPLNSNLTTSESVSIKPLQWMIDGSVGAEYKVNRLLRLYVEPGVGYYFDNGSSIPTLYQEKPFNFNLRIGLRLGFKQKP